MANQPQGLNGLNPLSYMGVNPGTPPNLKTYRRAPTVNDSQNFLIGAIWLYPQETTPATSLVWMLTALVGGQATWQMISFDGGGLLERIVTDNGTVIPAADAINAFGGDNINTEAIPDGGDNLIINLNTSIFQPATSADSTSGMYALGGNRFLYSYGPTNTFVGSVSGNLTLTPGSALNNTGVGGAALSSLTTGSNNTGLGSISGNSITTGSNNLSAGSGALDTLTTGSDNIVLGVNAGEAYTTSESSNIIIGNAGVVGEDNVIRIGTNGAGAGEQNATYVAGIYGATVGGTAANVVIDSDGKLGTVEVVPTSSVAFRATLNAETDVSGDGTVWFPGAQAAATIAFNTGSGFYPGDGAGTPMSFTAPFNGVYQINYTLAVIVQDTGGTEMGWSYQVNGGAQVGAYNGPTKNRATGLYGVSGILEFSGSTLFNLNGGDVVTWFLVSDGGAKVDDINTGSVSGFIVGPTTATVVSSNFSARVGTTIPNVTGDDTIYTIVYDTVNWDINTDYDAGTGLFTAPVNGYYLLTSSFLVGGLTQANSTNCFSGFVTTGSLPAVWSAEEGAWVNSSQTFSTIGQYGGVQSITLKMAAGDTVGYFIKCNSATPTKTVSVVASTSPGDYRSYWSGYLISTY